jgi:hypothetical protein
MSDPNFGSLFHEVVINDRYTIFETATGKMETKEERVPVARSNVIQTKNFLERLSEKFRGKAIELIPQNCRYIETIQGGKVVVIEEPPQIRTILAQVDLAYQYENLKTKGILEEYGYKDFFDRYPKDPRTGARPPYKFRLAFPYLVFVFRLTDKNEYSGGKVFFRRKSLLGLGEPIFKAPLFNINSDQGLCIGRDEESSSSSANAACQKVINRFWSATFNNDYNANVQEYKNSVLGSFFEWEYLTANNPMFIYSIDLIPNSRDRKLIDEIKFFRGETPDNPYGRSVFSFASLTQAFSQTVEADHVTKDPVYGTETPLAENVANSVVVKSGLSIDVGDRFKMKDDEHIVVSFLSPGLDYEVTHIKLWNDTKKKDKIYRLSSKFKNKIADLIFNYRLVESLTISGVELKKGDIVLMKRPDGKEFFKRVDYIRRNIDSVPEIKMNDEYISPTMIEKRFVKKVEVDKIEIRGKVLKNGDVYFITRNVGNEIPIIFSDEGVYDGITVNQSGLVLKFNLTPISKSLSGTSVFTPSLNNIPQYEKTLDNPVIGNTIINSEEVKQLPPIFRYFRNMYKTKYSITGETKVKCIPNKYFILNNGDPVQNGMAVGPDKLSPVIFKDDSMIIQSYDVDLIYSVGEKIIVADWSHPEKLLVPKTITGFKTEYQESKGGSEISFVLSDKLGNLEVAPFISHDGKIATGRIRKIVPEFNGIKSGTKIIAKETSISGFPKKDVNIIVGFLVDTGTAEPMVLCSNGLTLWASDLENFTQIPFTSKKWKTLDHVPIVDQYNIKLQPGDIVKGNAGYGVDDFMVFKHLDAKTTLRALMFSYFHAYMESVSISNNFRYSVSLDCIPSPRVSTADIEKLGYVTGFANLFGGVIANPKSTQQFIADPRSMIK